MPHKLLQLGAEHVPDTQRPVHRCFSVPVFDRAAFQRRWRQLYPSHDEPPFTETDWSEMIAALYAGINKLAQNNQQSMFWVQQTEMIGNYEPGTWEAEVASIAAEYLHHRNRRGRAGSKRQHLQALCAASDSISRLLDDFTSPDLVLPPADDRLVSDLRDYARRLRELIESPSDLHLFRFNYDGRHGPDVEFLWRPLAENWKHIGLNVGFSPRGPLVRFITAVQLACGCPAPKHGTLRSLIYEIRDRRR